MKISKIVFVLLVSLSIISCKKDDGGAVVFTLSSANFIDTYLLTFLETRVSETITFANGSTSTSTDTNVGSIFQDVEYKFNADGTFTGTGLYNTIQTILHPDGTSTVNPTVIVALNDSGTYTLNVSNNLLTLTNQNNSVTVYEITLYSETELRLHSETEVTVNNSTIISTEELRFTRI